MKHTLTILASLTALNALSDTLQVPQDFPTIPAAIAAAGPSDTVEVSAGTYLGFDVTKASCRIVGLPGAVVEGRVTVYESGAVLEDLRILGGLTSFYGVRLEGCTFVGDRLALSNTEGFSTIIDCTFSESALWMEYSDALVYGSMFVGCEEPIQLADICQLQVLESEFWDNGETDGSECASVQFDRCSFVESPCRLQGDQTTLIRSRVRGTVVLDAYECFGPNVSSQIVDCRITGRVDLIPLEGFLYGIQGSLIVGEIEGSWQDLGGNTIRPKRTTETTSAR